MADEQVQRSNVLMEEIRGHMKAAAEWNSVITGKIDVISDDVSVLKTDVAFLKLDVAVLKTDVAALKTDMRDVKVRLTRLEKNGVAHRKPSSPQPRPR